MAGNAQHADAPRPAARASVALVVVPAAVLLVTIVVLAFKQGGFSDTTWYPAALIALGLALVVLLAAPPRPAERWTTVRPALVCLAGLVAWGFASLLWADLPGRAWDGANRDLLYAFVFGLAALRPWRTGALRAIVLAVPLLLAAVALVELIRTAGGSPQHLFVTGRLASPTGYANATPNLWLMGALPALALFSDHRLHLALRALLLGCAGLLVEVALLSQSRGSVVAVAVAAILLIVLAPRRWPALIGLVAVAGATAASWSTLTAIGEHVHGAALTADLHDARVAIAISVAALLAAGAAIALADRAVAPRLGPREARIGNWVLAGAAVLLVAGAVAATGNPQTWVKDRWHEFKGKNDVVVASGSRLGGGLGSHRYDFYRVGLDLFADHPVLGVGLDSFYPGYLEHGRSREQPHYAHSWVVEFLADTGVVGIALLLGFLGLALAAALRALRRTREPAVLAAGLGAVVFLTGGAVDWLWQFPALGMLAFLLLGAAAATSDDPPAAVASRAQASFARRPWGRLIAAPAAVVAAISLVLPASAARYNSSAYSAAAASPQHAIDRWTSAARLDPLSSDPLLSRAIVQRRLGRLSDARAGLDDAVSREPANWFSYFERALVESLQRDWPAAQRDIREASRRNPRQVVVAQVAAKIGRRRPVDAGGAEQALAQQLQSKLNPG